MMKKDEKIIISKKLAQDLLWWVKTAPIPNNDNAWMERWGRNKQSYMEIAWESLVCDLKQAIKQAEVRDE